MSFACLTGERWWGGLGNFSPSLSLSLTKQTERKRKEEIEKEKRMADTDTEKGSTPPICLLEFPILRLYNPTPPTCPSLTRTTSPVKPRFPLPSTTTKYAFRIPRCMRICTATSRRKSWRLRRNHSHLPCRAEPFPSMENKHRFDTAR